MSLVRSTFLFNHLTNVSKNVKSQFLCRGYAFKSDLKIKWVHPGKICCTKPEKSGDLKPMPAVDLTRTRLDFLDSEELKRASDTVKRLFSLEFAPRKEAKRTYAEDVMKSVRRHNLDCNSIEAKLARWTAIIRSMQVVFEKYPKNIRLKVQLKELIDKRKKYLKYLRSWDYKRFEWLLERLDIAYKPAPVEYFRLTRKGSLRLLTNKYCEDLRRDRLEKYQKDLQEQQPIFLKEKIVTFEFLRQEQINCKGEITITLEEIEEVKKQLEELLEQRAKETKNDD